MAPVDLTVELGPLRLRTPLIAASGTVGSVWEWADVADVSPYGAAVAKSVSPVAWPGRNAPRLAPGGAGMLNGIGIQNPGIERWAEAMTPILGDLGVPIWGSAVGSTVEDFALVSKGLAAAGVGALEINLSCPNLEDGRMFALDADRAGEVVAGVRSAVDVAVGAKLSPNADRIVDVARACVDGGADFLILTNTALGFGVSIEDRRPLLSGGVGGYSGPGLKPIAMRCVYEVASSLPGVPIVGCGGVMSGRDVVEYMMAGASAVGLGTVHFAEPKAGQRILGELTREMARLEMTRASDLIGAVRPW
jgi:dihydroorotate dehydrogenase (NAD+) catalytic subunit